MKFLKEVFLRTPYYSFARYDLSRLPDVLVRPEFLQALRLASPVLYGELAKKNFEFELLSEKERLSVAKYYNRMCFRAVPFGAFAAFTLTEWGSGPVQLSPDAHLLWLPDQAARVPVVHDRLVANPTLYRLAKTWRYYRSELAKDGKYRYSLDELDAGRFTNGLIAYSQTAREKPALLDWIMTHAECSAAEAGDYIRFLLDDQVLYDSSRPSLITAETATVGPVGDETYYAAVERPLLSGGPSEVDAAELLRVLELLSRFTVPHQSGLLQLFTEKFSARFDLQKVPLLTALDPDSGIAYGEPWVKAQEPLLAGLKFPAAEPKDPELPWSALRRVLMRLWTGKDSRQLVLSEADLAGLPETGCKIPNTLAVLFRPCGSGIWLEQAAGSTANQLLGRFTVFSAELQERCRALAALEAAANPDIIFADVQQLSHTHHDNINRRRPVYEHQLGLNVFPGVAQLAPSDLLLSVRGGELILESQSLGKRVIPRLATAYNYHHNRQPLFRLLGDLQYQGLAGSQLPDLEQLFPGLAFYPRLVCGKVILSLAKWHFKATALGLAELPGWRAGYGLPALLMLGAGDRQLVFNLDEEAEARLFMDCIKGLDQFTLQEYLLPNRQVNASHQPLAAQYVGVLAHDQPVYQALADRRPAPKGLRQFLPGSDWLYLKLYCTPATADRLLVEAVRPVLSQFGHRLRGWFFIRYRDPEEHLRLRFRIDPEQSGLLLNALQARLKKTALLAAVKEFRLETYRPELERYDARYMAAVEKIFEAGSNLVIDQLAAGSPVAFEATVALADRLIACFYPDVAGRLPFVKKLTDSFLAEFRVDKNLRVDLDLKYRSLKFDQHVPAKATALIRQMSELAARVEHPRRESLLADLVHMQLNRTFAGEQRRYELLVYYCLQKQLKRSAALADQ